MDEEHSLSVIVKTLSNQFQRYTATIKKRISAKIKTKKVTESQGRIIHFLYSRKHEEVYQKDIEKEFNIRRSTATVILQLMEKNGLITREVSTVDGRLKRILLTKKAKDTYPIAYAEIVSAEQQAEKGISKKDMEIFIRVAKQISKNISS